VEAVEEEEEEEEAVEEEEEEEEGSERRESKVAPLRILILVCTQITCTRRCLQIGT